ncbi:SAM hydrolase/SAM-dependent halogenase family protein [Azospirillum picis]|uniref:S-adenosylmethionine hydrolase n=1 Tax=Azospirillum picis TaxID=488438 RepID=A0ABU0ML62_9PROT|nr:SAM-dependent chlorinase/fluorinase [Azospirillum picis]MBP2300410.1 S-adenosylmethionine hydrolase [Azospirillum picis]MDQ0534206.1 S-adenosylmethionine hydrolase [Azospirillum picis]
MILLFTDFGLSGPYTGQMKAVLAQQAPGVPAIDLFADAPAFDPQLSAYLLAAYAPAFPAGSVFLCVVDPGVGTDRRPVIVEADGRWFVGPDNGLFALVARRATSLNAWTIDWSPDRLSASFHGRDLFAPVAARLATGLPVERGPLPAATTNGIARPGWPDELARIVYVDVYGNAMTGLRAAALPAGAVLAAGGTRITRARTFGDVGPGEALWYENSNGLAEIAVNRGRADRLLGLAVGDAVTVSPGPT